MIDLRFDVRVPDWGAPVEDLYAAATDMGAWAEDRVWVHTPEKVGRYPGRAAMTATAMRIVNAVPLVIAAPPGLPSSPDLPVTVPDESVFI